MGLSAHATVSGVDQRFRKYHRLHSRADFDRVRQEGEVHRSRLFSVVIRCDSGLPAPRLGIIAGRRFGGAVSRSRIRRHVREAFRVRRSSFLKKADVVVIPRPGAATVTGGVIGRELERLWRKAGLMPVE